MVSGWAVDDLIAFSVLHDVIELSGFLSDDKQVCVSSKLPFILAICIFVMFMQVLQVAITNGL